MTARSPALELARQMAKAKRDNLIETMALHLRGRGLDSSMEREHAFAAGIGRRWRFDFAWPAKKVALEVEGGTWVNGRHNRGQGMEDDAEKYAIAAIMGWRLVRATTNQVRSGVAVGWMHRILTGA